MFTENSKWITIESQLDRRHWTQTLDNDIFSQNFSDEKGLDTFDIFIVLIYKVYLFLFKPKWEK